MSDEDEFHHLNDEAEGLEEQSSEDKMAGILQGLQSNHAGVPFSDINVEQYQRRPPASI